MDSAFSFVTSYASDTYCNYFDRQEAENLFRKGRVSISQMQYFLTRDHCFCFNFILNSDSSLEVMVMIKCEYLTCLRIMIMAFWFEKRPIKNTLLTYHSMNFSVIHSIANLLCSEKRFHKNCLNTKF